MILYAHQLHNINISVRESLRRAPATGFERVGHCRLRRGWCHCHRPLLISTSLIAWQIFLSFFVLSSLLFLLMAHFTPCLSGCAAGSLSFSVAIFSYSHLFLVSFSASIFFLSVSLFRAYQVFYAELFQLKCIFFLAHRKSCCVIVCRRCPGVFASAYLFRYFYLFCVCVYVCGCYRNK